jgi:alpha-galactosidase
MSIFNANNEIVMKKTGVFFALLLGVHLLSAQQKAVTPPMGYMTWNFYADKITENDIRSIADAMSANGLLQAGFNYIFIDDGWQGGRDSKNNIIPDPKKFPAGIKALCDYVHSKGMKLGIYSDAAQLTCAGYTASLGFEEQDAKTFASWGIDYLKYDYCDAPPDWQTAIQRYSKMADALTHSGRDIVFGICEWGNRSPWLWANKAGGQLWRISADVRDKWQSKVAPKQANDLHSSGAGILDILDINTSLSAYAVPGGWNDPDMLVVGLYGRKGPSGDLGGTGCTDAEYQSQMSLWCLLASPLMVSCDVTNMNEATKKILFNKEMIDIDQDPLGIQGQCKLKKDNWQVFVKPLAGGDVAVGVLNRGDQAGTFNTTLAEIGLPFSYQAKDVWSKQVTSWNKSVTLKVGSHETQVFRLHKK